MATATKEAIVLRALRRSGIASSAMLLAPEPESIQDALIDLEDMMAEWERDGVACSYRYTGQAFPQPSEESGVPDWAVAPIAHNLAIRILTDNQRPIPDQLMTLAFNGLEGIKSRDVDIPTLQRRYDMPRGAGNGTGIAPFGRDRFYLEHDALQDGNGKDFDL